MQASDGQYPVTRTVTVTVLNLEEPGAVGLSSEQPQVGTELTAALDDPDGGVTGLSWSWERSQNKTSWTPISGAVSRSYTPRDTDVGHYLQVTAVYSDGHGSGKDAQEASDHQTQAAPIVNNSPAFAGLRSAVRQIAENSPYRTAVGAPVTAGDADNDTLSYTLTDGDMDSFIIDSTGQIRVGENTTLDFETRRAYSVTVTVTDPSNTEASIPVDIEVTDVNEPPEAFNDTDTTAEDEAVVIDVLTNDNDPEGVDLTVTLRTSPTKGGAMVEADQRITYTPDADFHGVDTFTYRVSDGTHTSEATVAVVVDSVNDVPQFGSDETERSVRENSPPTTPVGAGVTARDPDQDDNLEYSLSGPDTGSFVIDSNTGQISVAPDTILAPGTYTVTVTATDPSQAFDTITVTIQTTRIPGRGTGGGGGGTGGGVGSGGGGGGGSGGGGSGSGGGGGSAGGGGGGGGPVGGGGSEAGESEEPVVGEVFADIAAAGVHETAVRALAETAVLDGTGCGNGRLCPQEPILRWEMAVWLVRVLDGADPNPADGPRFEDVGTDVWWAAHVERLAQLKVTVGCSLQPARYCATEPVTRAQMASFLKRAFDLEAAPPAGFTDTTSSVHQANIDALFAAGITVGCSQESISYCPQRSTTRAQMATFLHRAITTRN